MQRAPVVQLPLLFCVLLVTACSEAGPASSPAPVPAEADIPPQVQDGAGDPIPLTCSDDLQASFRFLGPETIELTLAEQSHVLLRERSASGARYVGDEVEFWNKGSEVMLRIGEQRYQCSTEAAGA